MRLPFLLALPLVLAALPASADGLVLFGNESSTVLQRGESAPGWDQLPPQSLPVGEVVAGRLSFEPRTQRIATVTYLDPGSGVGCHLRVQTEPGLGRCEVKAEATARGEGASCSARVIEQDEATCEFTAVLGIGGF